MCDSLCKEVGKSPLDIHHYRGRKNSNVLNVDNNGRTAKKKVGGTGERTKSRSNIWSRSAYAIYIQ